jgi:hypothetical protein
VRAHCKSSKGVIFLLNDLARWMADGLAEFLSIALLSFEVLISLAYSMYCKSNSCDVICHQRQLSNGRKLSFLGRPSIFELSNFFY